MKKKVLFLLSIICLSSALYLKQGNSNEPMSDMLLINVEALAQNEGGYFTCANVYGCVWHPYYDCTVYHNGTVTYCKGYHG
ncbi:MAG: NVEALA domain-containing protein [Tannerellaceae bacterium]|nr:NVEALA domain-containing protein [Tannerellaceae bacterium]